MSNEKNNPRKQSVYRNTVIFAVVAALVMVALLVVTIAVPSVSEFRYAFLTVNIGLLVIIINAIVKINQHNSKYDDLLSNASNYKMPVQGCPDYFTTKYNDGKTMCSGEYVSPRQDAKFILLDDDMNPIPDINVSQLDDRRAGDVCSILNSTNHNGVNHRKVPWTELRSKCNSLKYYL